MVLPAAAVAQVDADQVLARPAPGGRDATQRQASEDLLAVEADGHARWQAARRGAAGYGHSVPVVVMRDGLAHGGVLPHFE